MSSLKYSPVVFRRGTLVASAVLLPGSEDGALERGRIPGHTDGVRPRWEPERARQRNPHGLHGVLR